MRSARAGEDAQRRSSAAAAVKDSWCSGGTTARGIKDWWMFGEEILNSSNELEAAIAEDRSAMRVSERRRTEAVSAFVTPSLMQDASLLGPI